MNYIWTEFEEQWNRGRNRHTTAIVLKTKTLAPSALTFTGHSLAIGWIVGILPWEFALLSLVFDWLDGKIARKLNSCSSYGSTYDWAVDVTVSVLILSQILKLTYLIILLLPIMVLFREKRIHFSGRFLLTIIACITQMR